jgi:hypothetical protein
MRNSSGVEVWRLRPECDIEAALKKESAIHEAVSDPRAAVGIRRFSVRKEPDTFL